MFDTIYTEAQRQLIETFSAFAWRRLPKLSRPNIHEIENIATVIVIAQNDDRREHAQHGGDGD